MWPLDHRSRTRVLRIGKRRVEVRRERDGCWELEQSSALDMDPSCGAAGPLKDALGAALGDLTSPLDVVVESAIAPIACLQTADRHWSAATLEALALHRFREVHGDQSWTVRVHYVAGDPVALAVAVPGSVTALLVDLHRQGRLRLRSLQPALVWTWNRMRRERRLPWRGWYYVLEQDRTPLAWIDRGRLGALNPGARLREVYEAGNTSLPVEARRLRLPEMPADLAGWHWDEPSSEVRRAA